MEFERFIPCVSTQPPSKWVGGYSPYEVVNQAIEIVNELITEVNGMNDKISEKEDSTNITNARKLSEDGDLSGTLANKRKTALEVVNEIDNNKDQISYLASQFSEGQTGLIIDGGFFEETGIKKNYNGGVF